MTKAIFVADHDEEFRTELVCALRRDGYQVEAFKDGDELVERLRSLTPDLLIWTVRIQMDTFKALDTWKPGSVTSKLALINLNARTAEASLSGRLEGDRGLERPILWGWKPIGITTLVEAARGVLSAG